MGQPLGAMPRHLFLLLLLAATLLTLEGKTILIAHRGNPSAAPENTLAAFRAARGLAEYIEFDALPTRDGHLVVIHDETVDRTTNGRGRVDGMTMAQVLALDAGSKFSPAFAGERVPRFDEAIAAIIPFATPIVDHKAGSPQDFVNAFRRNNIVGRAILGSADLQFLRAVRSIEPQVELLWGGWGRSIPWNEVPTPSELPLFGIVWEEGRVADTDIEQAHARGQRLLISSVNSTQRAVALCLVGLDGIYTEVPAPLRQAIPYSGYTGEMPRLITPQHARPGQWLGIKANWEAPPSVFFEWRNGHLTATSAFGGYVVHLPNDFESANLAVALTSGETAGPAVSAQIPAAIGSSRLVNLSALVFCGHGEDSAIVGFVLASSARRTLLIRSVGPGLANYGVEGFVSYPRLFIRDLLRNSVMEDAVVPVDSNAIAALSSTVGAFGISPDDDARVLQGIGGGFTATVVVDPGNAGTGLVECYDTHPIEEGSVLRNLSTRARIWGTEGATAGFVIDGTAPRTVMLRGVGPTLRDYGVQLALADPMLVLRRTTTSELLAVNDDWSDDYDPTILSILNRESGAFTLRRHSKDSVLVLTLDPGGYTISLVGRDGTRGVALLEIYDLDL